MNLLIKNDGSRITVQIVDEKGEPLAGISLRGYNFTNDVDGKNPLLLKAHHVG